jgi:hypothetical protein
VSSQPTVYFFSNSDLNGIQLLHCPSVNFIITVSKFKDTSVFSYTLPICIGTIGVLTILIEVIP